MILNFFLLVSMLGWTVNTAVIQIRHGVTKMMWVNFALACLAAWILMDNLTPK